MIKNTPHKPEPQTSEDRDWATGIWNPSKCKHCEQNMGHPVHRQKYRNSATQYKLDREQGKFGKKKNG